MCVDISAWACDILRWAVRGTGRGVDAACGVRLANLVQELHEGRARVPVTHAGLGLLPEAAEWHSVVDML